MIFQLIKNKNLSFLQYNFKIDFKIYKNKLYKDYQFKFLNFFAI